MLVQVRPGWKHQQARHDVVDLGLWDRRRNGNNKHKNGHLLENKRTRYLKTNILRTWKRTYQAPGTKHTRYLVNVKDEWVEASMTQT